MLWGGFKITDVRDPRVVHQDIYVTILKYLVESDLNALLNRNVAMTRLGVSSSQHNSTRNRLGGGRVYIEDVDTSPGLGKCGGDGPSNTTAASGHDGNFMSEALRFALSFQVNNLRQQITWTRAPSDVLALIANSPGR